VKSDYFRSLIVASFVFIAVLSASQRSFLHATTEYDDSTVNVVLFGDSGKGNSGQKIVGKSLEKFCTEERCDFVTLLGDNFYPTGVTSVQDIQWRTKWSDIYQSLGLIFYAALGNHDYGGNIQAQIEFSKRNPSWYMPGRYYQFKKSFGEFFVIDTEKFDAPQAEWLKEQLDQSTAKAKIVYGHHPIYSYGSHGDSDELIRDLLPILRGRASMYLAGHDHDKQVLESPGDLPMVVVGTAADLRPVRKGPRTKFAASTLGFGSLQVSPVDLRLRILDQDLKVEYETIFPLAH